MAIYHLTAKVHTRAKGHSAVAGAAYLSRSALTDERTGIRHDYSRKSGDLLFQGIYAPKDAPAWARDRTQLWNHVETCEKRSDSQLAHAFEIALPHELTLDQNRQALQDWVRDNFMRKRLIADVAIHAAHGHGDERNIHAHVMVAMRKLDGTEFAAKREHVATRSEAIAKHKAELEALKESWERIGNRHLERHGFAPSLDRRSFEERGIQQLPTVHLGKEASALERKGIHTERGNINRAIKRENERLNFQRGADQATSENSAEAKQERPAELIAKTAPVPLWSNVTKTGENECNHGETVGPVSKKAGRVFGGLARIAETVLSFIDWSGGPKLTEQQVHEKKQAEGSLEKEHAEAEAEARKTREEEFDWELHARKTAAQRRNLVTAERLSRPVTDEALLNRENDHDHGRERNDYERERYDGGRER